MNIIERMFAKAMSRVGLVRKRVPVHRAGATTYETRWIRPEDAGQMNMFAQPAPPPKPVPLSLFDNESRDITLRDESSTKEQNQNGQRKRTTSDRNLQTGQPNGGLSLFAPHTGVVAPAKPQPGKNLAGKRRTKPRLTGEVGGDAGTGGGPDQRRVHVQERGGIRSRANGRNATSAVTSPGLSLFDARRQRLDSQKPLPVEKELLPLFAFAKPDNDISLFDNAPAPTDEEPASVADPKVLLPETKEDILPIPPEKQKPSFEGKGLRKQEITNSEDFVITHELDVDSKNLAQKAKDNFAAIELLKSLESENRLPTQEEKSTLAKYVGWGAFGQAFHPAIDRAIDRFTLEGNDWIRLRGDERDAYMRHKLETATWDDVKPWMPDDMQTPTWQKHFELNKELQLRMTPEEKKEAWASTRTAFYTQPIVVNEMWEAVKRLGIGSLNCIQMLEPGCGAGNFFGLQPQSLREKSRRTGVELDGLTGRIAQFLYPAAQIHIKGLQKTNFSDESFNLVIGNPPFGDVSVNDKEYIRDGKKFLTRNLHGYFIAKGIDKLKPGGIMAFVVSRQFMDSKKGTALREHIQEQANFLGAVRLPSDAFEKNAGTSVTTDIVFFQKRDPAFEALHPRDADGRFVKKWTGTEEVAIENHHNPNYPLEVPVNEYFADHPENMLGKLGTIAGMYSAKDFGLTRDGYEPEEFGGKLREALQRILPENVVTAAQGGEVYSEAQERAEQIMSAVEGVKDGAYGIDENGNVGRNISNQFVPIEFRKTKADPNGQEAKDRLVAMIGLRDAVIHLNASEVIDESDEYLKARREDLNHHYDAFVRRFGTLHDATNQRAFAGKTGIVPNANVSAALGDPDAGLLLALEVQKDKDGPWEKADIFHKRIIRPNRRPEDAASVEDAYGISLNEYGGINWVRMSELLKKEPEAIRDDLARKGFIFRDPEKAEDEATQGWITADEYLTGNVRKKLDIAREVAEVDPSYKPNVTALEAVQPERIPPGDIDVKLGASWVPQEYYEEFIKTMIGQGGGGDLLTYNPLTAQWIIPALKGSDPRKDSDKMWNIWGTQDYNALQLLVMTMNGKQATVTDTVREPGGNERKVMNPDKTWAAREKQNKMKAAFADFMLNQVDDPGQWATVYNDLFNTNRQREYDGSHLTLPGMAQEVQEKLFPHVKNFVWRAIQDGTALADHVVGAGKTVAGAASMMELRRLGLAKKPMAVVPCHLVAQWADSFREYYPGAKVLTVFDKDWTPDKRKEMTSRIATGDWDAVIISHTAFGSIPLSENMVRNFFDEQISELRAVLISMKADDDDGDSKGKSRSAKQIEKMIETAEVNLEKRLDKVRAQQDYALPWEQLGVDTVLVDEFHYFKNLFFPTRHTRLPGLGGSEADRAMDMFLKTQDIQKKNNGRGLIGLSGTPISNSLSEMYTLGRYFMLPQLKDKGIGRFDAWLQTFGNIETNMEAAPEGGYRQRTRVKDFSNMPELSAMYRQFADVKTAADLNLPTPEVKGGAPANLVAEPSAHLTAYMGDIRARAQTLTNGKVDPREDNFLKLTSDARKAALDMRLVEGHEDTPDDPGSKVNLCIHNVVDAYKRSSDRKGTQLIFLDLSTPKGKTEGADHPKVLAAAAAAYNVAISEGRSEKEATAAANAAKKDAKADLVAIKKAERLEAKNGAAAAKADAIEAAHQNGESAAAIREAGKKAEKDYYDAWDAEHNDADRMDNPDGEEIDSGDEAKQKHTVYNDIRQKLIAQGIPENEIVFAHDFRTDAKKAEMQSMMNRGDIRVLIGSTGKMGAGLNVQERLFALHHLDCPWKPSDLEQREGRIIRQGNMHHKLGIPVEINRYATKGSFDEFMWQQIENKAKFIAQARNGKMEGRRMDDIDDVQLQAAAMKAASSDSPEIAEITQLNNRKAQLESLKRSHINEVDRARQRAASLPREIAEHRALQQRAEAHAAQYKNHIEARPKDAKFGIDIDGKHYTDREEAGKAMVALHKKLTRDNPNAQIGKYAGFNVHAIKNIDPYSGENRPMFDLRDDSGSQAARAKTESDKPSEHTLALDRALRSLDKVAEHHKRHGEEATQGLQEMQAKLEHPEFEHEDELHAINRKMAGLEAMRERRHALVEESKEYEERNGHPPSQKMIDAAIENARQEAERRYDNEH